MKNFLIYFHNSKIFFRFILVFLALFSTVPIWAQSRCNPKSEKIYSKGGKFYNNNQPEKALSVINSLLKKDSSCIKALLLKADLMNDLHRTAEAISAYKQALRIDPAFFPKANMILAGLYFEDEEYASAKTYYQKYLDTKPKSKAEILRINENMALCDYRLHSKENPVEFEPINLGPGINSAGFEYVNSLSLDGNRLLFTRKNTEGNGDENFFSAEHKLLNDSAFEWQTAIEIGEPLNTPGNEGALCMSADGQEIIITACGRPEGFGSCDLYYSHKKGNIWTNPVNLGQPLNTTAWESQPCLSADGRTLYFVSTRAGGHGGSDIYKSVADLNGNWSKPQNLGDSINTEFDEYAPFIHPDGRTLYFSSRGLKGMGGADLYVSKLSSEGYWQHPINLGYPINTKQDEINLMINASGDEAYISSVRKDGYGNTDIYKFRLPVSMRPEAVSYVRGKVYDSETLAPLAADFELFGLANSALVAGSRADAVDGSFILSLPFSQDYALNVSCPGHLFYSRNFSLKAGYDASNPLYLEIPLQPIKVGERVILRNIFFATDQFSLLSESKVELDKLRIFLEQNPAISIEISGHTDNEGSADYNFTLSQHRAEAVYDYLVSNGINKSRLLPKGYGETQPVDTNNTPEGRANNRRTEFKILGK